MNIVCSIASHKNVRNNNKVEREQQQRSWGYGAQQKAQFPYVKILLPYR